MQLYKVKLTGRLAFPRQRDQKGSGEIISPIFLLYFRKHIHITFLLAVIEFGSFWVFAISYTEDDECFCLVDLFNYAKVEKK